MIFERGIMVISKTNFKSELIACLANQTPVEYADRPRGLKYTLVTRIFPIEDSQGEEDARKYVHRTHRQHA